MAIIQKKVLAIMLVHFLILIMSYNDGYEPNFLIGLNGMVTVLSIINQFKFLG